MISAVIVIGIKFLLCDRFGVHKWREREAARRWNNDDSFDSATTSVERVMAILGPYQAVASSDEPVSNTVISTMPMLIQQAKMDTPTHD